MNDDLCELIVNHANQIFISLVNLNGQLNENGSLSNYFLIIPIANPNPTTSNTSTTQGLAFMMLLLFGAYALLSIFSPQRQQVMQKGNIQNQQNHND
ncbi:unnamed protein product (macronuclear) [Paramecium tetraurelia]|uniref:Uncharacterized protein n=1 Tax=Paramecium tetraurelia TaxID=5888 RepID=A0ECS8_PARTE|nr:uncharacterized protein GSPATT00003964001 [Paramecium tetraurelia]CAK93095.1 unnamed protein product [Paramecium tetraurelia]|eukprot:XP_001460492.1 hypothetical protein (macronuclear) [Paramecium tetraurelia strain d4-2]